MNIQKLLGGGNMSYSLSLISKYRTELMGYGILFIMLVHATNPNWADIPILCMLTGKATALVHTVGFLIISGFGLCYSLTKNSDIWEFYKRRLMRLYIPFLLIALPFYLFFWLSGKETFVDFLLKESGLAFFVNGSGLLWYIAISILMYILAPLIFKLIKWNRLGSLSIMISLGILFCYMLYVLSPDYFNHTKIGYEKGYMFAVGMYLGFLSLNNKRLDLRYFLIVAICYILLVKAQNYSPFWDKLYKNVIPLFGIPIVTIFFKFFELKCKWILNIFHWLGKYSLELYILHVLQKNSFFYAANICGCDTIEVRRILVITALLLSFALCVPIHDLIDKQIAKSKLK